ncbi:GntR family transcriptional regulator [Alteromonas sp. P256]|uniref:GntR family transcriptional regulator n=1 Tax=Alteromonas sp. P256 TaxID=3117399 RepID=UPI002FE353E8
MKGKSLKLADKITDSVRNDILTCAFMPETKLKINELAKKYAVSLGAVREALSSLSAEGLVLAIPQKGFVVAPVSIDELVDLTKTRIEIEKLCIASSIKNSTLTWKSNMVAALYLLRNVEQYDTYNNVRVLSSEWSNAHEKYHEVLVSACDSQILLDIRAQLYAKSERYRRLSVPLNKAKRDVAKEHESIGQAALDGDIDLCCSLIASHLRLTMDIVLSSEQPFEIEK